MSTVIPRGALALLTVMLTLAAPAAGSEIRGRVVVLAKSDGNPLPAFDHAVVYLETLPQSPPGEPAVMDQQNKRYEPRLVPAVQGQEVEFRNSDRLQHNVFSPHPQEPFDLGRYAAGDLRRVRLHVPGPHPIYCNIHKSMLAYVYVVPSRHFAVTDPQGRFTLTDLPPGTLKIRAWHIFGGTAEMEVTAGDVPVEVELTLRSTRAVAEVEDYLNQTGQGGERGHDPDD
jgi:plastocyanin